MLTYLHGFASSPQSFKAQHFAARFADLGISLNIPQLDQGDFENMTLSSQLAVVEAEQSLKLSKSGNSPAPVVLIGSSLGGYLSTLYAAKHPVDALILMAPAVDFYSRWTERLGPELLAQWKNKGHLWVDHFGSKKQQRLSYALFEDAQKQEPWPKVNTPTLVFHGKNDDVVPQDRVERWCEQNQARLVLFDSGHELTDVVDTMFEQSRDFLASIPALATQYPSLRRS